MQKKKKNVCMLCGHSSAKSICDSCAARVQGEALGKTKNDKPKK